MKIKFAFHCLLHFFLTLPNLISKAMCTVCLFPAVLQHSAHDVP